MTIQSRLSEPDLTLLHVLALLYLSIIYFILSTIRSCRYLERDMPSDVQIWNMQLQHMRDALIQYVSCCSRSPASRSCQPRSGKHRNRIDFYDEWWSNWLVVRMFGRRMWAARVKNSLRRLQLSTEWRFAIPAISKVELHRASIPVVEERRRRSLEV